MSNGQPPRTPESEPPKFEFQPEFTESGVEFDVWRAEKRNGHPALGALSPSRASDFTTCPLLYRYRAIDRLPEPPSAAAARGTLVHEVLESIFDLPAAERVLATAVELLPEAWESLVAEAPELAELVAGVAGEASETGESGESGEAGESGASGDLSGEQLAAWLSGAEPLLRTYFRMEDPRRLEPAHRELHVECELPDGPVLRGFVDRVDIAPGAGVRIVDYKTGRAPGPGFEQKAMFQLRFYALVVWRMTGEMPALLQLNYLGSGEFLRLEPTEDDLERFEVKVRALWRAILARAEAGDWPAKPNRLCGWCSFHEFCPAQGGTLLPMPVLPAPTSGSV